MKLKTNNFESIHQSCLCTSYVRTYTILENGFNGFDVLVYTWCIRNLSTQFYTPSIHKMIKSKNLFPLSCKYNIHNNTIYSKVVVEPVYVRTFNIHNRGGFSHVSF